jgi:hypothetical protein
MAANVLNGARIIVWAENELLRAEIYAHLTIKGWQADARFPEQLAEFRKEISSTKDGTLPVIVDSDGEQVQEIVDELFRANYEPHQIILGCPKASFVHRVLLRHGFEHFLFENTRTPTGPKIDVSGVAPALLRTWKNVFGLMLNKEVNEAVTSGFLACLKILARLPSTAALKERAHLAHALAEQINNDFLFRRRVVRFALFSDLSFVHDKNEIISESRSLWPIKDLFDYTSVFREVTATWPADLPLEYAIVKTAQLFQSHQNGGGSVSELSAP